MSKPKAFFVYYDSEVTVCRLEDDEAGQLFKSLFPYGRESIRPDFEYSPALAMAFDILAMAIDRDKEHYQVTCERNAANARKRWDATACDRMRSDAVDANIKENKNNIEIKENKRGIRDYQQIADLYNDTCVSLPRVTTLSEARKKAIRARLNTYSLDDFKRLFELAEASSFLKGQNSRNWTANFDWLIKDANMAKVLDGQYNDSGSGSRQQAVAPVQHGNRFNNFTSSRENDYEEEQRRLLLQNMEQ